MNVFLLQWFLVQNGFNPGPIDGVMGPITRRALAAYQKQNGLLVTGEITSEFVQDFLEKAAPNSWPRWVQSAIFYLGLEEIPGEANNPTIMRWARALKISQYQADSVAWCGLFTSAMLNTAGSRHRLPENPLWARNFLKFGKTIEDEQSAQIGDIIVLWREPQEEGYGHVGFFMGGYGEFFLILGGNQDQRVSIKPYSKSMFLGFRRPI